MNIRFFQTFLTVVEEKSFSSAARRLNLTQPAVTKHIQTLEKHFDSTLFKRRGWRSELTPAGEALLAYAERIVSAFEEAEQELKKLGEAVKGILKVGASTIPGEYVLPLLVGEFSQNYPEVHLQLEIADSGRVRKMIMQRDLDLGLVGSKGKEEGLEYHAFAEDQLILIVPADHPWAQKGSIKPREIIDTPLIWREKESGTREMAEMILAKHGVKVEKLQVKMELGSTEAVLNAIASGAGATIISRDAAQNNLRLRRLVEVPINGVELTRPLFLVHRKEETLNPAAAAFVSFVKEKSTN